MQHSVMPNDMQLWRKRSCFLLPDAASIACIAPSVGILAQLATQKYGAKPRCVVLRVSFDPTAIVAFSSSCRAASCRCTRRMHSPKQ